MTERRIVVIERPEVPLDAIVLGYGPVLVFPVAAASVWLVPGETALLVAVLAQLIGGALLCFLAGVRRGLSFRTTGGPRPRQILSMLWLFLAGLAVVMLPPVSGTSVMIAGFLTIFLSDPGAARRGEAPLYFARLRPPQMAIALAGQVALLAGLLRLA